jgi:LmbE family N-acetylglucosaminyl deacetylase
MTGWEQNANERAFINAPLDEAAARLSAILTAERVDTLTVYDYHGGYGHPDHIAVHKVGHRAAELAGTPYVYEATMNRDRVLAFMAAAREAGQDVDFDPDDTDDGTPFGMPEAEITTAVDVTLFVDAKRRAMACHASQITDSSFFLQMPPDAFQMAFGTEWFIRRGLPDGLQETWLAGLEPLR